MELKEKDIEDIIYSSPWLIDERFVIPNIKGKENQPGRQINIGGSRIYRYIDLLFKDTRDNRPVIVELKKGDLTRENIAQILEYKALVISLEEDTKVQWENEFGRNYFCPKLLLIGINATEEIRLSANLTGIEIRTLAGEDNLKVDFNEIGQINEKLNEWSNFLKSGNRTLIEREDWIPEIYDLVKEVIDSYDNNELTTANKLDETKNGWIIQWTFPFINIPFSYKDGLLGGLYEYGGEMLSFSDKNIYFDIVIQSIYNAEKEDSELIINIENEVKQMLKSKKYNIIKFEGGIVTVKINRSILGDNNKFKVKLKSLLDAAIEINEIISARFGKQY